jgi:hypothetical protein
VTPAMKGATVRGWRTLFTLAVAVFGANLVMATVATSQDLNHEQSRETTDQMKK